MYDFPAGEYVRGFLSSNDLTTAAAIPLFNSQGVSRTLGARERIVIASLALNNGGTASVLTVFCDVDADGTVDTGEGLYAASLAANGNNSPNLEDPLLGVFGFAPSVKASAASAGTTVVLVGTIIKS